MKPILEMNDEELYEFYLDSKNTDNNTNIVGVFADHKDGMLKNTRLVGRNKNGWSEYKSDDVNLDIRFENDALIFKIKEAESNAE